VKVTTMTSDSVEIL